MSESQGLRERNKQETRRQILKAADTLFHKNGFDATTLEQIAAKAGVHKQTVLRYFGTKDAIAVAFRESGLRFFRKGLLDPDRTKPVIEYWREFIHTSALNVISRGDLLRYNRLVESEPALMAAALKIQMQYERLLAAELSREAGLDSAEPDLHAQLLAAFLVGGNFSVARTAFERQEPAWYPGAAMVVIDLAEKHFPRRAAVRRAIKARLTTPSVSA